MVPLEDPTTLSLLFHLNSEPWLNDEAYRGGGSNAELKVPKGVVCEVQLPPAAESPLTTLLRRRESCREFARQSMPVEHLSALVGASYGGIGPARFGGQTSFIRRTVPSAGALFPLELYAFTQRVEGVRDGLHHYDVTTHSLQQLHCGNLFPVLERVFYAYPFMKDANVVVVMVAIFRRTQTKYGPRGYRYILLEAGHAAQNFCLRAGELGLASLCMGGFVDSALNEILRLEPQEEGVVYTVAAGFDSGASSAPQGSK